MNSKPDAKLVKSNEDAFIKQISERASKIEREFLYIKQMLDYARYVKECPHEEWIPLVDDNYMCKRCGFNVIKNVLRD